MSSQYILIHRITDGTYQTKGQEYGEVEKGFLVRYKGVGGNLYVIIENYEKICCKQACRESDK